MKKQVRFPGLVKLLNEVRDELRAGVTVEERDDLERRVTTTLQQVEGLCTRRRTKPTWLPAPSRNAYRFLKGIDFRALPTVSAKTAKPRRMDLSGVVAGLRECHRRIWNLVEAAVDVNGLQDLRAYIRDEVASVERTCEDADSTPAALAKPSRSAFALLKFLSQDGSLEAHVDTVRRLAGLVRERAKRPHPPLFVEMTNFANIWQRSRSSRELRVRVHEMLIGSDDTVLAAVVDCAVSHGTPEGKRRIDRFCESEAAAGIAAELDLIAGEEEPGEAGCVYHLGRVFARVNTEYFASSLPRPQLTWSQSATYSKFGHYAFSSDTVLLSVSLDRAEVPEYVVDFIMYHELLHKKHGVSKSRRRKTAHTSAFKRDEKAFKFYHRAEEFLAKYSRKLRQRR